MLLKRRDSVDQGRQAATEAIQFPDNQHIALTRIIQGLAQAWPIGARAGSPVFKYPGAAGSREGVVL